MESVCNTMEYTALFEGTVRVKIPVGFYDMTEEIAKRKYPIENRPAVIKTNVEASTDFKFNIFEQNILESQIESLLHMMKTNMMKMNSGIRFGKQELIEGAVGKVGWMEYENPAIDGEMYNVMSLTKVDGKMIQGFYNCNLLEKDYWKPYMLESLKTILEGEKAKDE